MFEATVDGLDGFGGGADAEGSTTRPFGPAVLSLLGPSLVTGWGMGAPVLDVPGVQAVARSFRRWAVVVTSWQEAVPVWKMWAF